MTLLSFVLHITKIMWWRVDYCQQNSLYCRDYTTYDMFRLL